MNADEGLSASERRSVLDFVIQNGFRTQKETIEFLQWLISYNGKTGYIHKKYVAFGITGRTTAGVNFRTGAGTGYAVIGKLKRGTGVTILEKVGNWRRVKTFKGQIGWVSANYLTKQATAKVTASALNVRKGPGTNTTILGSLKRGTKVTVQYTSGNWAYVSTKSLTGYVSLNYLVF